MFTEADKKILQTGLIAGGVALLGLIYYIWAFVNPEIAGLDTTMKTQSEQIKKRKAELNNLEKWKGRASELVAINQALDEKLQRLPKTADAREFYGIVSDCIAETKLTNVKAYRLKRVDMGGYEEIPYALICRARYHELGQFLGLIEQNPKQIMRVRKFEVSADAKRPSRHKVNVEIATFMLKPLDKLEKEGGSE